ncbi:MAG: hypothetical protein PUD24_06110 [Oscillospiraceae bacterium]|nr:hypothetical protein [Oscillospiraceae bacterium]
MFDEALLLFKNEFWKDSRTITVSENSNTLKKHYNNQFELDTEVKILNSLKNEKFFKVPLIKHISNTHIEMQYFKGIRIFNLLVELDLFSRVNSEKSKLIKKTIINQCEIEQIALQHSLINLWEKDHIEIIPYPFSKLTTAVEILKLCLDIECNDLKLSNELNNIYTIYKEYAKVPFRDATTKNMILADEYLHLDQFHSIEDRRKYLFKLFDNENIFEYLASHPIINLDFSSCINTTTPEDDYISLHYHERTYDKTKMLSPPLNWLKDNNPYRAAITFIIRFLRFGGRKAAYKILHDDTAKVRFKYDNPQFYFKKLPLFVNAIYPEICSEYPYTFKFINDVYLRLQKVKTVGDYFMKAGFGSNEKTYFDIFPN